MVNLTPTINFTGTDRFEVISRLGAGGMGVVYEVLDRQRDARVALKFLQQAAPQALFAFKQEFRTLADVSHPNLVGLYELFSDREQWFFTMELVEDGVDLQEFILGETPLSDRKSDADAATASVTQLSVDTDAGVESAAWARDIPANTARILDDDAMIRLRSTMRQLAEGLCEIHVHGLLHRDVKPSNVLVRKDGRVVVLDFGLASEFWVEEATSGRIFGTVAYMSPEQASGQKLTPASDWYSVGAVLYQVLTGRCPFEGSPAKVLGVKQTRDPRSARQLNPAVPEDLNRLTMALLSRDPRARPSAAEVLRAFGATDDSTSGSLAQRVSTTAAALRFVGRREPLDQLIQDFATVRAGGTAVALVRGESGTGKTTLVQHFLEGLPCDPVPVVLAGRCYEQESVPFKAFDSLIDALTRYLEKLPRAELVALLPHDVAALARIFPVVLRIPAIANALSRVASVPDQIELRRRGFAALREMLARIGDQHPLILLIDDLQWGDVDSANLFNDLLKAPDPPMMLVVGTYRAADEQHSECLRMLAAAANASQSQVARRVITLSPLSRDESLELALGLLDRKDPVALAEAEQIVRESNGSPYFLSELARHVRDGIHQSSQPSAAELVRVPTDDDPDRVLTTSATTGDLADTAAAGSLWIRLDDALWRRIERLPEDARTVLEVLSVASRPLRLVDALKVAHVRDSHGALNRLRNDHFMRATGVGGDELLAPYHDRIRETFVSRLSAVALRNRHLSLATTLAAGGGADAQTLAIHYEGAGDRDSAGRHYAAAADEAGRALAFEQAANLYHKSLALRPSSGTARFEMLVRLADALANSGRGVQAGEQYLEASTLADADEALMLQSKAGFNFCAAGDIDAGRAALGGVLDRLGTPLPRTRMWALVSLLWNRVRLWMRGINFRERSDAELSNEERMRLDVTWSVACGLTMIDTIRGADFQTRNLLLALKTGEPYRVTRALGWEATHAAMDGVSGRRRTQRYLTAADRIAERLNNPHAIGMAMMSRGVAAFFLGDLRESAEVCDRAATLFNERCTGVAWELDTSHAFAYWARFLAGRLREVQDRFPRLIAEAQQRGDRLAEANFTTYGGPFVFLAKDDADSAREALSRVMGEWSQQDFHVQHFTTLSAHAFVNLYRDEGLTAWEQLHCQWKPLASSFLLQVEIVRIYLLAQRANCALAAAEALSQPGHAASSVATYDFTVAQLEREASRTARRLERERPEYAKPLAQVVRAALAARAGRRDESIALLTQAVTRLDALEMKLVAAAARFQLGRLLGGTAGREHTQQAEQWMQEQGILRPDRIAAVFAEGFREPAARNLVETDTS